MKANFIFTYAAAISLLLANITFAQLEPAESADQEFDRERIVITVKHGRAIDLAKTLEQFNSQDDDFKLVADSSTNKLVIEASRDLVPGALGLIRELDKPRNTIEINLVEAIIDPDSTAKFESGPTKQVAETIKAMGKAGSLKVVNDIRYSGKDNTEGRIEVGATSPVATGVVSTTRVKQNSYNYQQIGTIVKMTPRAAGEAVDLDLIFETSEMVETGEADSPPSIVKTIAQSQLTVAKGQSVVMGGIRQGPDNKPVLWRLIISASVVDELDP